MNNPCSRSETTLSTAWVIVLGLVLLAIAHFAAQATAHGGELAVQFDAAPLVECRDVTPSEFAALNPDERLIEATFIISSLVRDGRDADLVEYLIRIDSPRHTARVVDYLPKTTLATDVVGSVGIHRTDEQSRSIGINVKGDIADYADATANGATTHKNSERRQLEKLPPLELLSATGTTGRGSGVYFKLKPSTRTSLEGAKEYVAILRVPVAWRGDIMQVDCRALASPNGVMKHFDDTHTCGSAHFHVAMYQEGDPEAKAAAVRFVDSDRALRDTVRRHHRQIKEKRYPTRIHRVAAKLSVVEPKIPDHWFHQVLHAPPGDHLERYARYLPEAVAEATKEYHQAKVKLHKLSAGG